MRGTVRTRSPDVRVPAASEEPAQGSDVSAPGGWEPPAQLTFWLL